MRLFTISRRHLCTAAAAAGLLAAGLPTTAAAQPAYPSKPVKLVVPFPPGVSPDVIARLWGEGFTHLTGQPVVVENRPGAGGAVGSAYAAKQPADGYTLVMEVESSHAVNPNVYVKTAYDPVKDFAPISNLADVPNVLVVNPSFPATDLQAFIRLLKANPGKTAVDHDPD